MKSQCGVDGGLVVMVGLVLLASGDLTFQIFIGRCSVDRRRRMTLTLCCGARRWWWASGGGCWRPDLLVFLFFIFLMIYFRKLKLKKAENQYLMNQEGTVDTYQVFICRVWSGVIKLEQMIWTRITYVIIQCSRSIIIACFSYLTRIYQVY